MIAAAAGYKNGPNHLGLRFNALLHDKNGPDHLGFRLNDCGGGGGGGVKEMACRWVRQGRVATEQHNAARRSKTNTQRSAKQTDGAQVDVPRR